jgi:hypothetical protein
MNQALEAYGAHALIEVLRKAGHLPAPANVPAPPVDPAEREIFRLISNEVARARNLMPGRTDMFVALTEEVGELAQALIDQKYKAAVLAGVKKKPHLMDMANLAVLREAVQVGAMAVRIATEGDEGFRYEPPAEIKYATPRMGWGKGEKPKP